MLRASVGVKSPFQLTGPAKSGPEEETIENTSIAIAELEAATRRLEATRKGFATRIARLSSAMEEGTRKVEATRKSLKDLRERMEAVYAFLRKARRDSPEAAESYAALAELKVRRAALRGAEAEAKERLAPLERKLKSAHKALATTERKLETAGRRLSGALAKAEAERQAAERAKRKAKRHHWNKVVARKAKLLRRIKRDAELEAFALGLSTEEAEGAESAGIRTILERVERDPEDAANRDAARAALLLTRSRAKEERRDEEAAPATEPESNLPTEALELAAELGVSLDDPQEREAILALL